MVDKLSAERQELEELVKAEQAEKEFFLRKLMEANKDPQSLNTGKKNNLKHKKDSKKKSKTAQKKQNKFGKKEKYKVITVEQA
jgi:hypothetical protein